MPVRRLHSLLQKESTNLHHLASDPIRVLLESLLWIDGQYWIALPGGLHVVPGARGALAGPPALADRRSAVPHRRDVPQRGIPVLDHPGGADVPAVDRRARHRRQLLRHRDRRDDDLSHRAAVAVGLPRRLRLGVRNCAGGQGELHRARAFVRPGTRSGLLSAGAGPIGCRSGIRRRLCGVFGASGPPLRRLPTVAISDDDLDHLASLRGTRAGRRTRRATSRSARCWSTATAKSGSRTATGSQAATPPGTRVRHRPLGDVESDPRRTRTRHGVHLGRALPDVRGRARLGRAGPHRLRDVGRAADQLAS